MKLSSRLALTTAAVAILLFGAGGALVLRNAERNLRYSAERQTLVLGRSLQVAFESALHNSKLDAVAETLKSLTQIRPDVDMFVFDEHGTLLNSSDVMNPSRGLGTLQARLRASSSPSLVEFVPLDSPENIRVALPLRHDAAEQASTLVLERPLTTMRKELDETRRSIAILVTGFIAVVVVVTTLIMRIYVGRPLAELVDGMRRMREGNRPQAARHDFRNDEIGEAQRAFAALVTQLDSANLRLNAEQDARQRMTRSLEAADKLITLGQMSAVLAHEIGSPLQVMEGRARALVKSPDDPAQTKRTAEILVGQAERITRIVSHMLHMTRRPTAIRREIDPASVVRRVLDLVEYEARRRKLTVTLDVRERGSIHADPDQLEQIVLNLCRNAFEAAPQGTEVRLVSSCGPGGYRLDVTDHGEGIPPETSSQVFEPFFTTKGHAGGSGLGLSVVKSLVEQHDGMVNYVSSVGEGTTFSVVLPNEDTIRSGDTPSFVPVRPPRRHYPLE